jgi:gluconate 2-dehydrogenase gamma chain
MMTNRRSFSTAMLAGAAATLAHRTALESRGHDDPHRSAPDPNRRAVTHYRPTFFTPAEWLFINAACARLIPTDEHGPGAIGLVD